MPDKIVDVAAGILIRPDGQYLLGSRPQGKPFAGFWEFPGGKLEAGETALDALKRELTEELGITVLHATPWIMQTFTYPHAKVRLHFFRVTQWQGEPHPHEGQAFAWQTPGALNVSPILPANGPILRGLAQSDTLAFSNVKELGEASFLAILDQRLKQGKLRLVLREPQLSRNDYLRLANIVQPRLRAQGSQLIVHQDIDLARQIGADGLHLASRQLAELHNRPRGLDWVGASNHHNTDLQHVQRLNLDYAVLGHIKTTASHPDQAPLGWDAFAHLVSAGWPFPIYAIGGMRHSDIALAQQHGGHGVAILRAFWIN